MPRGRPKKDKPSIFSDPKLKIPEYAKQSGKPVKLGKMRGWKSILDWDYSTCDQVTQNILSPKNLEVALRDWHTDLIKNGFAKRPRRSVGANQIRKEKSENLIEEISKKYSDCFIKINDSEIARCIERKMKANGETPRKFRTLRKYVAKIKKVGTAKYI